MKTLKSIFSAALTAVVLTSTAFTTFATEPVKKITSSAAGISKIWVSGNVKIVLTQGNEEGVIGTENFDAQKTSVVSNGQTMYINSMEAGQVTINVSLKDLQRVEAYGQSVVVANNFDVKHLQLFLNQSASAKIKTNTGSLYSVVNDDATLRMSGSADQSTIVASNMDNVKLNNFATLKSEQYVSEKVMKSEQVAITK